MKHKMKFHHITLQGNIYFCNIIFITISFNAKFELSGF